MAIDSGSFVKPAFFHCRIHSNGDGIFATIVDIIGHIVFETQIARGMDAQIMSVEPNCRIAENTIKSDVNSTSQIFFWDADFFSVPTNAGLWKLSSNIFESVTEAGFFAKTLFYCPIVWQIEFSPRTIVKIGSSGSVAISGFGQIREITRSIIEIFTGVKGMTKGEFPIFVDGNAFSL